MAKDKHLVDGVDSLQEETTSDDIESFTNSSGAVSSASAVYISGNGSVGLAVASNTSQYAIGLVFEVTDATNCRVITSGLLGGFSSGMTAGTKYYLSASTAGALTTTRPTGSNYGQLVGIAYNATDLLVLPPDADNLTGYSFPTADGTNSQVLVTNGSGALSFANQSGGGGGGSDSWIAETRGNFTATLQANKYYYNGLIGYNAGVLAVSISDTALATMGAKILMQKAMMGVVPVNANLTEWKLTGFKDGLGSNNVVYDVNADIQLWKASAYANGTNVTDPTLTNIWDFTIDVDGDQLFTYGGTLSSGNSFAAGDGWFITVSRDSSGGAPYSDHYWHLALKFEPS